MFSSIRGSRVNVIAEQECCRLKLPKPTAVPFKLRMAHNTLVQPIGLLREVKIHIQGIFYMVIPTIISFKNVNLAYTLLLDKPWLQDAHVIHDWTNNHIQIMGIGTIRIVCSYCELDIKAITRKTLVYYNYVKCFTDKE